jgi:uncharacterized membrane protein
MEKIKTENKRIWELDFLRGFLIFAMIIYHLFYFFYRYIYLQDWEFISRTSEIYIFAEWCMKFLYYSPFFEGLKFLGWQLFFIISGISSTLSKSNVKRAVNIGIFVCAMVIANLLCSVFIRYAVIVGYGVFFIYFYCMLLFELIRKKSIKVHIIVVAVLAVVTVLVMVFIPDLSASPLEWFGLSKKLKLYNDNLYLFPMFFSFFVGGLLGKLFYEKKKQSLLPNFFIKNEKMFAFIGRHSMKFYIGHIILLPLIFITIAVIFNP